MNVQVVELMRGGDLANLVVHDRQVRFVALISALRASAASPDHATIWLDERPVNTETL